jgi:hypothetical protein
MGEKEHTHVASDLSSSECSSTRTEHVAGKAVTIRVCWTHYVSKCSCGATLNEWDGPESHCG